MIIKRLMKNNVKFHKDLKILRIVWLKRMIESEKIHSSLIIKIAIKMNEQWNESFDFIVIEDKDEWKVKNILNFRYYEWDK